MNYALIEDGIVTNVIWLHPMNADEFPNAVALGDVPAGIGDSYDGEAFYRDGERVLSYAEREAEESDDMRSALALLGVETESLPNAESGSEADEALPNVENGGGEADESLPNAESGGEADESLPNAESGSDETETLPNAQSGGGEGADAARETVSAGDEKEADA